MRTTPTTAPGHYEAREVDDLLVLLGNFRELDNAELLDKLDELRAAAVAYAMARTVKP